MSDFLFVYGTLLRDFIHESLRPMVDTLEFVDQGMTGGVLYDLGVYPGAVFSSDARGSVRGTLFRMPDARQALATFDTYEDFDPDSPDTGLFRRVLIRVQLDDGRVMEAWAYHYNRATEGATIVTDGDYRAWRAQQLRDE